jgi:hypothetical protein
MQQLCTEMQVIATNLQDPNKFRASAFGIYFLKCKFGKKKLLKF